MGWEEGGAGRVWRVCLKVCLHLMGHYWIGGRIIPVICAYETKIKQSDATLACNDVAISKLLHVSFSSKCC